MLLYFAEHREEDIIDVEAILMLIIYNLHIIILRLLIIISIRHATEAYYM